MTVKQFWESDSELVAEMTDGRVMIYAPSRRWEKANPALLDRPSSAPYNEVDVAKRHGRSVVESAHEL